MFNRDELRLCLVCISSQAPAALMSDLGADACQQQCSWCHSLGQSLLLPPRARLLHSGVQTFVVAEPMFSFSP